MKKVYSNENIAIVHNIKNVLENSGIEAIVKGQDRSSIAGGIPATDCWPEIWILDDSREEDALRIVSEAAP